MRLISILLIYILINMKHKKNRSIKKINWQLVKTNKPFFWLAVIIVLAIAFSQPNVRSWFRVISGMAYNWTIAQITNDAGFEWAIDSSYNHRVLVAKGSELDKPKNLYVYNTDTPQKPPIKVLTNDIPGGDSYLASAKISGDLVVYTKLRPDGQGSSVWVFTVNADNTGGTNVLISPEDSTPSSKKWRVRPDITSSSPRKIIYQDFDMWGGGQIRRGDLMMVDPIPNAIPVLVAPKVAIVGNHWEYEDPSVTISPRLEDEWIMWRDLIGNDLQNIQTALYAVEKMHLDNKITLLPPSYFPSVGSFDIDGGTIVASVTTKGAGGKTNTNIFTCTLFDCIPTIKLVNTQNTYPYIGTQVDIMQGMRVAYMVEKPKSDTNPAPVHQQWRYHNLSTGEDNLIAELGSSTNTTVLTERFQRPLLALMGTNPVSKMVSVITRRAAPGGLVSQTEANIFAALGIL